MADDDPRVRRIKEELSRYEHPLLQFDARVSGAQAELLITLKIPGIYEHPYSVKLTDREVGASNFPWSFQRLLYNCVHDYLIEMFERTPHTLPDKTESC